MYIDRPAKLICQFFVGETGLWSFHLQLRVDLLCPPDEAADELMCSVDRRQGGFVLFDS